MTDSGSLVVNELSRRDLNEQSDPAGTPVPANDYLRLQMARKASAMRALLSAQQRVRWPCRWELTEYTPEDEMLLRREGLLRLNRPCLNRRGVRILHQHKAGGWRI